jgi:hypothetical protein
MTYASTSVDRRAEYYARCASVIAADPLDFYTRAEKGRRFQANQLGTALEPTPQARVVAKYLKSVSALPRLPVTGSAPNSRPLGESPMRPDNLLAFPRLAGAMH